MHNGWYSVNVPDAEHKEIVPSQISADERWLRSRLVQLVSHRGVLRGTLSLRERKCGKPGCKCTRGEKHHGLYLVFSESGRYQQVFASRKREARVRQWVKQYQEVRRLLQSLSVLHLAQLSRKDGGDGA